MRSQDVVSVWDKNNDSWISIMRKLWQSSKVKMWEESIKSMKSRTQKWAYSKYVHKRARGRRVEKSVIRYVCNKWMAHNKCCGTFFIHWSSQVNRASPPAKKVSLFSSIIITIILSYAIIEFTQFYVSTCRSLKLKGWQNCI